MVDKKKYVDGWDKVSLRKYIEMLAVDPESEDAGLQRMAIANGMTMDELMNAPLTEANQMAEAMEFLKKEPRLKHLKKAYVLNGTEYTPLYDITKITTAQYITYDQLKNKSDLIEVLSLVMVPTGHLYNDGYDIEKAKADVNDLTVEEAVSICDFFTRALAIYVLHATRVARKALKKAGKDGLDVTKELEMLKLTRREYRTIFLLGSRASRRFRI